MRKLTLSDITPTPKPQLKTSPVNRVIFINDRSVSMGSLRQESVNDTLEQIKLLAEKDAEIGSETFVSVVDFGGRHNFVITSQPAKEVRSYIPKNAKINNGSTAPSKGGQSVGNFYTVNTAKVTEEDIARLL